MTAPSPDAPIGVFDSGVGGLTVARAILDQLPRERVLYVGDTAHSPYGPKPIAQVRAFALEVLDRLVGEGVKALVIACNTASSAVLRDARERYEAAEGIPVVEVVHPAVRAAVRSTRNGRVGVIGTVGTIASRAYEDAFAAASGLQLVTAACPRFVEFVEAGVTTGDELLAVAEGYLAPLRAERIDTLVLGCTHYPLLAGAIRFVMGPDVALVSSADETAADLYRQLVSRGIQRQGPDGASAAPPEHRFETTGDDEAGFRALAARFLGPEITHVDPFPTGALAIRSSAPADPGGA